jgi:hypothetical protein
MWKKMSDFNYTIHTKMQCRMNSITDQHTQFKLMLYLKRQLTAI